MSFSTNPFTPYTTLQDMYQRPSPVVGDLQTTNFSPNSIPVVPVQPRSMIWQGNLNNSSRIAFNEESVSPRRDTNQGILSSRNNNTSEPVDQLQQQSYETLVKQLYGLPVTLPESLVVNGLKLNFIPFSQLSTIQIERYIIEPLLQPWAGPPNTQNRILTIFGKNGMSYLVKARYDQATNQIFQP